MSKHIPPISKYMSTTPISIEPGSSLKRAADLMETKGIRHLPVLSGEKLVGLVTQSDLRAVSALSGVNPDRVKIEDIMRREPYTCSPDAALDAVVEQMAAHKWGSAVVLVNHKVVGIFTAVDAMLALVALARTRLA